MKVINTDEVPELNWIEESMRLALSKNLICLTKPEYEKQDYSPLQWFGTNIIQSLAKAGNTEICPLYGGQIKSREEYCYQLCRSIPWGFEMGTSYNAIYDVLLNFETQPQNRVLIWYDCQVLFNEDKELFKEIFEAMIVAGYLNSIGESTHDYQVNQKNIFLFQDTKIDALTELLEKEYYTPGISFEEEYYMKHEFEILEVK